MQRKAPSGMCQAIFNGIGHDALVFGLRFDATRLEKSVCGANVRIAVWWPAVADDLEFVTATEHGVCPLDKSIFGRERHPIGLWRNRVRAIGFNGYESPYGMEFFDERSREEERGLATCDHDVASGILCYTLGDLFFRELFSAFVEGVAEVALQVASAQSHENGRRSGPKSLTLQGIEDLIDFHAFRWVKTVL